jgi:hypothetical protein
MTQAGKARATRVIVRLTLAVYLLLIFEGAIRKWLLPGVADVMFFVRAPLVLLIYFIALYSGLWPRRYRFLLIGLGFAIVALVLVPIQLMVGGYDNRHLVLAVYGWHNYFLYIPLAFLIGEQFSRLDLYKIARITLVVGVVTAPLVIIQYFSPADSPIVIGFGTVETERFSGLGYAEGRARPMGFFTSSLGQQLFVASLAAFVIASWISSAKRETASGTLLLVLATIALFPLVGFSAQRGTFIHTSIVVGFALVGSWICRRSKNVGAAWVLPLLLIGTFAVAYPVLMATAFEEMVDRWRGAAEIEAEVIGWGGIFGRILYEVTKFAIILVDVPWHGYLLGLAGNAAAQLDWVRLPPIAYDWLGPSGWAEDGFSRNIVELGPVVGSLFILFRISLFVWLIRVALRASTIAGDPLALLLVAFVGPLLTFLQMTGQGTIVGYTWLFVGFCIAAARCARADCFLGVRVSAK